MRKGRPKYPQPRDVTPVIRALQTHVSTDEPMVCEGMRESIRHVPNYRIRAQTNEIEWFVDIYKGQFYHVSVKDSTEICRNIPTLVNCLWRLLGISPKQGGTGV